MINVTLADLQKVDIEGKWNDSEENELIMHTIHAYPAKFPSFIASKTFEYAQEEGVRVNTVADMFCGCGTVALEAKLHNKEFWGCDINPVATLIAKTKSNDYSTTTLKGYFKSIEKEYGKFYPAENAYDLANERLKYWFSAKNFVALFRIKHAIDSTIPHSKYREAFYCLFSSVLKPSSRWLTKSIKPQIDPNKTEKEPWTLFVNQYEKFLKAVEQIKQLNLSQKKMSITTQSFITKKTFKKVDLIISSPPYVTSYEYADLHQLSSLWLNFTDDYKALRKGSIGSAYNSENFNLRLEELNNCGQRIVQELLGDKMKPSSQVKAIARYYIDMQRTIHNCAKMLNKSGMVFFVVGDTEYKGVKIKNSEHLIECMVNEGFTDIKAAKRTISNKLLTPYRDKSGKFSSDKSSRTIYHEEFVISGRMY